MLLRYVCAAVPSRTADAGARVTLPLVALQTGGGPAAGGVLLAALLLPHVIAAPVVGAAVDRSRRPGRTIAWLTAGFGGCLGCAALLAGRIPWTALAPVLLVGGSCGPAITGALTGQLRGLVAREQLPRMFGVDSATFNVAGLAGPACAALLSGLASARTGQLALAGAAIVAAAFAVGLPACGHVPHQRDAHSGIRVIAHDHALRTVTAATAMAEIGAGALPVVVALAAARAGVPSAAGWVIAAGAVGGFLGSAVWTARPAGPARAPAVVAAGLAGTAVPILLAAAHPSPAVIGCALAVSGVATGAYIGAVFVVRDSRAPQGATAQVFAIAAGLKMTAGAAGAACVPLIAGWPVAAQLLAVAGISLGAAGLAVGAMRPTGRAQPEPVSTG